MTGISRPNQLLNHKLYYSTNHPLKTFHTQSLPLKPTTFNQAFKISKRRVAMNEEISVLFANKSWALCPCPQN